MTETNATSFAFDPSALRHRICLKKPAEPNADWQTPESLETIATVWAGILSAQSRQNLAADQIDNAEEISFVMRYRSDLDGIAHVEEGGQSYALQSMHDPDHRKNWLILKVRSEIGHGL
ncbi:phage head closure protein [Cohaesibacter intestini]|uniref:phage head closure protein n=1 Tax=Cohaesibacter intestini TaxID=2211145 RepID=UPI000DE801E2|nr:phage head closure protein [Cohaesibacter intestini]